MTSSESQHKTWTVLNKLIFVYVPFLVSRLTETSASDRHPTYNSL